MDVTMIQVVSVGSALNLVAKFYVSGAQAVLRAFVKTRNSFFCSELLYLWRHTTKMDRGIHLRVQQVPTLRKLRSTWPQALLMYL